ncbi:acyltransferase family protein [Rothia nasimurium]|uniref:acyltransferase family protein n=1 Tax=Rothia nasimurium TaxID=85336 RepID=UPI003C6E7753
MANHFWPRHLTGGYIGVDIFFVISGYLITLHLLKELTQHNTINLKHFYASRARRLLPAALFVGTISFTATLILTPPNYWTRTAWDFFASSAYFHNWNLYTAATDYFAQDSNPTVFQHYWSLSVEEQFYLIWPAALALLFLGAYKLKRYLRGNDEAYSKVPPAAKNTNPRTTANTRPYNPNGRLNPV